MRLLARAVFGTRRVNSVFGEGSSPRTRQIREGLNLIGINNEHVLKHSLKRRVYACELFPGARNALTGFDKVPAQAGETVARISQSWVTRWMDERVRRPEIFERLRQATPDKVLDQLHRRASSALVEAEVAEAEMAEVGKPRWGSFSLPSRSPTMLTPAPGRGQLSEPQAFEVHLRADAR